MGTHQSHSHFSGIYTNRRATAEEGGEQNSRAAQQSSQGILRFYTDEAPGFQM
jgi:Sec61beta family